MKVLDVNKTDKRLSLSIKDLVEKENDYQGNDYEMPEENKGFSISDVIGDRLKDFK